MDHLLLYQNLNKYTPINEEDFRFIERSLLKHHVKKKRIILRQGEVNRYLYFVLKGALRSYTIDKLGNEHIIQFAFEDYWVADLSSFITQAPGEIFIETIEDIEVLLLPYHELDILLDKIPALEKYFRHLYQRAYVGLQKRVNTRDSTTAKERYKELITMQPEIAKRIPLLYIASYLGITPESLSRVRRTLASEK